MFMKHEMGISCEGSCPTSPFARMPRKNWHHSSLHAFALWGAGDHPLPAGGKAE